MFRSYSEQRGVDPSAYDKVFDGDVDCDTLEGVFKKFNTDGHPLFTGRSMSVSDVVALPDGSHNYCDSVGFKRIDFDASQAQEPEKYKVVVVEPHKKPYVGEIAQELSAYQHAVGGWIEHVYNGDGTLLVCNEESKLIGLDGNRRIEGDVIAGTFFVVGDGGEDYRSLTDAECEKYLDRFDEPEDISPEEIEANSGYEIFFGSFE